MIKILNRPEETNLSKIKAVYSNPSANTIPNREKIEQVHKIRNETKISTFCHSYSI